MFADVMYVLQPGGVMTTLTGIGDDHCIQAVALGTPKMALCKVAAQLMKRMTKQQRRLLASNLSVLNGRDAFIYVGLSR